MIAFSVIAISHSGQPFSSLGPNSTVFAQSNRSGRDVEFRPIRVIPAQPAITSAPIASADKAGKAVTDSELVLGVVVNGKPRAYPINMLTGPRREIINDTLGGRAIAATW